MVHHFKNNFIAILMLICIAAIAYFRWLNFSAFAFADWGFGFKEVLIDFLSPNTGGIYGFNILLWKFPFLFINGIWGYLGFDYNVVEKITVFWPIIFITPISSFLLVRKITKDATAGVIGSLIFTYNTYFLSINTQGHELLPLAFAWAVFAVLTYIQLLETKKMYWLPLTVLILFGVGSIDLRSLYVTSMVLGLYAVFNQLVIEKDWRKDLLKNILKTALIFFLLLLCNIFWILPALNVQNLTQGDLFYSQLFGTQFYNIQNALAFFYPFWTGKETTWHYLQKIPISFWLYPILAFTGLLLGRKNKNVLFFGLLSLIGIFLSKQGSPPFSDVYPWLFQHFPGFAAFREASKFNFLIVLSYSVLIGSFVTYSVGIFNKRKFAWNILIMLLALLPLWNTVPLLTGEIKSLFVPKSIPQDFRLVNDFFTKQKEYMRVFALNYNIFWSFSTSAHPVTEVGHSVSYYWKETGLYKPRTSGTEGKKVVTFLSSDEARRLLSSAAVGYLVVNLEERATKSNIRRDMGENRVFFETELGKIPYLERQNIGLKDMLLYKNKEAKPSVYITEQEESFKKDIPYSTVDSLVAKPAKFSFVIKNLSTPIYLNASSLYHPDWKVRIGTFKWYESLFHTDYFLPESFHLKNAVSQNSYRIDPAFIKDTYQKSEYKENSDGSIDVPLTLYFRPQSYLYAGLIVSVGVVVALIISVFYFLIKETRREK